MRRWPTWLLVGALVALGAVAVADALRGGDSVKHVDVTRAPGPLIPPNEPAGSAMSGVLYYTGEDCVMRALELPLMRDVQAPRWNRCDFSMAPEQPLPAEQGAAWQPQGGVFALDRPAGIELGAPASTAIHVQGHSPAFKPDGTFTYVRGNAVVEWTTVCPQGARLFTLPADNATARCRRVVLSARDIRRGPISADEGPLVVKHLVWLTNKRLLTVLGEATRNGYTEYIAVFERRGIVGRVFSRFGEGLRVEASPRGRFFTAWYGHSLVEIRNWDGDLIQFPPLTQRIRAMTWSPDERWTAVATDRSVFVFRTDEGEARVRRLPIRARALAWR